MVSLTQLKYLTVQVLSNITVHYLEAGDRTRPTVLLLHGFPAASYQYETLAALLAPKYHVIAPDFPGFGLTTYPSDFTFTFDNLAEVTQAFLTAINVTSYAVYIFDYGAPVGLRIALKQPDAVKAIISQNGNAYDAGFGQDFWAPIFNLWNTSNSQEARQALINNVLTLEATNYQYYTGVPESERDLVNPYAPFLDYLSNLKDQDKQQHQLDLFYDYRTNPGVYYSKFHKYFRQRQPPLLAIWGKGDPAFVPAGAEAFKEDLPHAEVRFVDAGHFALETKVHEIAEAVLGFLERKGYGC